MIYPLHTISNHFFLEESEHLFLIDTGAPCSFGIESDLELVGQEFNLPDSFMGLTTGQLSEYISADCCGLLGADVLGKFDIIFHQPAGKMTLTSEIMQGTEEEVISLEDCLGIPIIKVNIDRAEYRMYLDTGAQFSYLQNDSLVEYPVVDTVEDFFPGYGTFEIDLHEVTTSIGDKSYDLKLGKLPDNLVAILSLAGVQGIIGNEIFMRRTTNYYPRRGKILFRD